MSTRLSMGRQSSSLPFKISGFTIIELMVAMLLGLIVIAGVSSVFLANMQSYRSSTALSNVQTNARIAFELMASDMREAGLTGCNSTSGRVANVLKNGPYGGGTTAWWANWSNAVRGYEGNQTDLAVTTGSAEGQRIAGTDSLMLIGASGSPQSVKSSDVANYKLTLYDATTSLVAGDVVIVCNPDHATVMQASAVTTGPVTVSHNVGTVIPGNFSTGLGYPTASSTVGAAYIFPHNSKIFRLAAHDWFIGNSQGNNGRSLYRITLVNTNGTISTIAQEMVRNITNMQITYHIGNSINYVSADLVGNWAAVDAVRVTFTVKSQAQRVGTDVQPLLRTFSATTTLRNRT